jgi:hypothetical protein
MKQCTRCFQEKEITEFGKQTGGKDGLKAWCKRCALNYKKLHYDENVKKPVVIDVIENELWLPLPGFEGYYEISDKGRLKSLARKSADGRDCQERILKNKNTRLGYQLGYAYNSQARRNIVIHRAVAIAFIPNPNNYPEVNHINGIKADNRKENLEWCTRSYNLKHAYRTGLRKSKKGILKKAS